MKTFKIVALQVLEEKQAKNIPLKDGLIINKENEDGSWVIEAFIDAQYKPYFEELREQNMPLEIRVIITHAANDPAPFTVKIHQIVDMEEHISVLFSGRLSKRRNEYLELLLDDLIKEGLEGEELLTEFKARMKIGKKPVGSIKKSK
ncbi:hypothetical protein JOC94_001485 [Bacillus thermophilus]|uniref:YwpF-like protein n=1 Tax=Siminovitchia thermophila TaxID=1245522 RepID=A0ABS2R4D4_9BACI|nr:YwpF family protein [Siminovitchia thermophila]MBM7714513.1 hypothetical protein [Siminovitchia thermophila]ONK24955.1 hypothetical protein BLX87_01920 [Bacillus sp. VT-16-64]